MQKGSQHQIKPVSAQTRFLAKVPLSLTKCRNRSHSLFELADESVIFDPIADKLFFLSVSITWIGAGKISLSEFALLGLRETGMVIGMIMIAQNRWRNFSPVKAQWPGKITTAFQYATFFSVLLLKEIQPVFLWCTAMAGLIAAVQYLTIICQRQARSR